VGVFSGKFFHLVELCQTHDLDIPGAKDIGEDQAKRQVGSIMRRAFKEAEAISVDGYAVNRGTHKYRKPSGDLDSTPDYTFSKNSPTTQPPKTTQPL
jgi:hypothetical protein